MKKSEEFSKRVTSDAWNKSLCERICAHRDERRAKHSRWAKLTLVLVIAAGVFVTNYALEQKDSDEVAAAIEATVPLVPVSYQLD